jgi:hypothetical protein
MALPDKFKNFKHAVKTDVANGKLTYVDAIVLIMRKIGAETVSSSTKQIEKALATWVPKKTLQQYISGPYCGSSKVQKNKLISTSQGLPSYVKTFWFKSSAGRYMLTNLGVERAGTLHAMAMKPMQLTLDYKKKSGTSVAVHSKASKKQAPKVLQLSDDPSVTAQKVPEVKIHALLTQLQALPVMTIDELITTVGEIDNLLEAHELSKNDLIKIINVLY